MRWDVSMRSTYAHMWASQWGNCSNGHRVWIHEHVILTQGHVDVVTCPTTSQVCRCICWPDPVAAIVGRGSLPQLFWGWTWCLRSPQLSTCKWKNTKLGPVWLLISCSVQCCFMSTETIRTTRDREPRKAISTFTQLLSSDELWACKFRFNVALHPQRPWGLLWKGSPGLPPQLSHSSWALNDWLVQWCPFKWTSLLKMFCQTNGQH